MPLLLRPSRLCVVVWRPSVWLSTLCRRCHYQATALTQPLARATTTAFPTAQRPSSRSFQKSSAHGTLGIQAFMATGPSTSVQPTAAGSGQLRSTSCHADCRRRAAAACHVDDVVPFVDRSSQVPPMALSGPCAVVGPLRHRWWLPRGNRGRRRDTHRCTIPGVSRVSTAQTRECDDAVARGRHCGGGLDAGSESRRRVSVLPLPCWRAFDRSLLKRSPTRVFGKYNDNSLHRR